MRPVLFLAASLLMASCSFQEPPVYEWRGPDRSGRYAETGLLKQWPEEGPAELWYLEGIGSGYGSPVVTPEYIYVTGSVDSTVILSCIDLEGNLVWKTACGSAFSFNFPGSRSAPTVAGDKVYAGTGMGNLYCMDRETGDILWKADDQPLFQGILPRFGHSEAPAVDGDRLFWVAGGEEHNVVALDRHTGDIIWSHPGHRERASYNSPLLIRLPARTLLVTFTAYHFVGFDAETGELLWSHEQENTPPEKREPGSGDTHANTALFDGQYLYYMAGDGNGTVKLRLSSDGTEITEEWRTLALDSYMQGAVKVGDYLYGSGTRRRNLYSLDTRNGALADSLKIGSGALIEADSMLYYYNWKGELHLVSYREGKMDTVSHFRIRRGEKEHFSHPVIRNKVLYQRHGDVLMAFDIALS